MSDLVPATERHITAIFGQPFGSTVRAIAAEHDGKPWGCGVIFPDQGRMVLLFKITDEARAEIKRHAKDILRGAKTLLQWASKSSLPVITYADTQYPRARELVEHLGFRHIEQNNYEWRP